MSRWGWGGLGVAALAALAAAGALALPWMITESGGPGGPGGSGGSVEVELSPALASLRSGEYEPRFGLEYWMGRYREDGRGGELGRALRYCSGVDAGERPNCRTVRVLDAASRVPGFFEEGAR